MKKLAYLAGVRVRSPSYRQDHHINRDNMRDTWCGRPLDLTDTYRSQRVDNDTMCKRCARDDAAWQERQAASRRRQKGLRYSNDSALPSKAGPPVLSDGPLPDREEKWEG